MNAQTSTYNRRLVLCAWLPMVCALGWLWFRLIDHLRVEWTVNPQYSYGWAVPFLCLYLIGRHLEADKADELRDEKKTTLRPDFSIFHPPSSILYSLVGVCALLYAPTRLIQEANPEWRLVSWALALEVVGITLALLALGGGGAEDRG